MSVFRSCASICYAHRPHRSLQLLPPAELGYEHPVALSGDLKLRDRLGGLIHEYRYAA